MSERPPKERLTEGEIFERLVHINTFCLALQAEVEALLDEMVEKEEIEIPRGSWLVAPRHEAC